MYSSSPQTTHYYDNHGKHDPSAHTGRYGHDASNPSQTGENHHVTSDAPGPPSSWHNDYPLESPTSATSPPFSMQHNTYPSMLTPPPSTSAPYVLSHSTDNGAASTMDSGQHTPGTLSYGYGLSHRGFFPRPKLTTTLWEDERTICFQVDANGICVARREDNDMINGTKLLNVAGMSRGKRDGILKNEKGRVVVKVGAMHLKGVWVTFDRAKALAAQFKIQTTLYPLFVDNPQSFLYSHPITSPISRLGSFRPFYPSSYDHVLSSSTPVEHHHGGVDHSSPSNAATPASFGYRPGSTPGPPALPPQSTSSYGGIQTYTNDMNSGGDGNNDLLEMEYRSGGSTLDSLTNSQVNPTSPTHESPYYNHLLDTTPRSSNEMPFHDANNKDKMMISTALSGPSDNNSSHSSSFLENQHGRDISKRPTSGGVPLPSSSAFQSLDSTLPPAFHHPQPIYTGTNSRDHYHHYHQQQQQQQQQMQPSPTSASSTQHYFANPLSAGSSSSSSSTSILNNHPCTTATDLPPDNKDHRRDSLVMTRNNAHQRHHHPYANPLSSPPPPPKLPHHHPYLNNSVTLKKPPSGAGTRHLSSQNLVKEMDPLSVKPEPDYLGRPW